MYYEFISFLEKHNIYDEKIILSFFKESFRYDYDDNRDYGGCLYVIDKDNVLVALRAIIPNMVDYKTMLINIHEYIHYYMLYKKLNKEVIIGMNCEVLPMLYERIFVIEKNDKRLEDYELMINDKVRNDNDGVYLYALSQQDKLIHLFNRCGKIKRLENNNI